MYGCEIGGAAIQQDSKACLESFSIWTKTHTVGVLVANIRNNFIKCTDSWSGNLQAAHDAVICKYMIKQGAVSLSCF